MIIIICRAGLFGWIFGLFLKLSAWWLWAREPINEKIFFLILAIFLFSTVDLFSQLRSFDDIFPDFSAENRALAFSDNSYVKPSQKKNGFTIYGNSQNCGLDPKITVNILSNNPVYFVESISVIPGTANFIDIYNALGKISDLKGRLYLSVTKRKEVPLFEEATRIVSEKQTSALPDPSPSAVLPNTDIIYIRLKDANFGNTYYKAEMSLLKNGLIYTMTNFKNINYMLVPVMKEGKFIARLYIEPIQEGVLIYSIACADISDFVASKIHIDSAITKRLAVITSWAADGIINK